MKEEAFAGPAVRRASAQVKNCEIIIATTKRSEQIGYRAPRLDVSDVQLGRVGVFILEAVGIPRLAAVRYRIVDEAGEELGTGKTAWKEAYELCSPIPRYPQVGRK